MQEKIGRKRKWNFKPSKEKKGKFSDEEKTTLFRGLAEYIANNNLDFDQTVKKISEGNQSQNKAQIMREVCKSLPQRSIASCYKYFRRTLNRNNYQGKWQKEEEIELQKLQKLHGNDWRQIGESMGRSAQNVRDKFRGLKRSLKKYWTQSQLVRLLQQVQNNSEVFFIKLSQIKFFKQKQENEADSQKKENIFIGEMIKYIDTEELKRVEKGKIKWKQVSENLGMKTQKECKKKFDMIHKRALHQSLNYDMKIVKFVISQTSSLQTKISWRKWDDKQYSSYFAKKRWNKLLLHFRQVENFSLVEWLHHFEYQIRINEQKNESGNKNVNSLNRISQQSQHSFEL